jgi:uncharacterized pyridoxamine 5'-phosphate oxidase family protein
METCDRCGPKVRAAVTVTLPNGLKLSWCKHHEREYYKALMSKASA